MPDVSVVIPSYNHAGYIAAAIQSVLKQTYADFELIVVDDGSVDDSLEVISGFTDPRMRVITQKNQGAHSAINRGLQESSGRYLAILNSDDAYHPQRLEKAIRVLEEDPSIGLLGTFIEVVDHQSNHLGVKHGYQDFEPWPIEIVERSFRAGSDLRAALLTENYFATTSNYIFGHDWYERVGEFRPLRYAHDWDFALRMARLARLELLPEPLMRYRVHPKNTIRENQAAMIFEICWCLAVHLPSHFSDEHFFREHSMDLRLDQLVNSIYTYSCERILSAMLVQNISSDRERSLSLLQPGDPAREIYLEYITRQLASRNQNENNLQVDFTPLQDPNLPFWLRSMQRLWRSTKALLNAHGQ